MNTKQKLLRIFLISILLLQIAFIFSYFIDTINLKQFLVNLVWKYMPFISIKLIENSISIFVIFVGSLLAFLFGVNMEQIKELAIGKFFYLDIWILLWINILFFGIIFFILKSLKDKYYEQKNF